MFIFIIKGICQEILFWDLLHNLVGKKDRKKDGVSYICEKCDNEMFKFSVKANGLFTTNYPFKYKKYLNTVDPNGPYYTCQFCSTIHKGYYTNGWLNIDFRLLNKV